MAKGAVMAEKPKVAQKRLEIVPDAPAMSSDVAATLYADVEASLSQRYRDKLARMSSLAKELQLWIWSRPGPEWSYAELARQLSSQGYGRVPIGTVGAWFSRGTKPKGQGYQAILKLTGWPEAHLLALLGRGNAPTYVPDVWDFVNDYVDQWTPDRATGRAGFDDIVRGEVRDFLASARAEYQKMQSEANGGSE